MAGSLQTSTSWLIRTLGRGATWGGQVCTSKMRSRPRCLDCRAHAPSFRGPYAPNSGDCEHLASVVLARTTRMEFTL
eukprot:448896-Amphidinium_carterae.2